VVGKFLLGMVSGGLLVAGGLVVGSVVAPLKPANENAPVSAVEQPITAPEATDADAGAAVAPEEMTEPQPDPASEAPAAVEAASEPTVEAPTEPEAPDMVAEANPEAEPELQPEPEAEPEPAAEPAPAIAEPTKTDAAEAGADPEVAPEAAALPQPEVVGAESGPTAPEPVATAAPEPAAPAAAEVAQPETSPAPAKPVEATADAAAPVPEPTAPVPETLAETPADETLLADAGDAVPAPEADATVEPAPEPAPAAVEPEPTPEATDAEAPDAVPDPTPDTSEPAPAADAPVAEEPVTEAPAADVTPPAAEPMPAEAAPAEEPATTEAGTLPGTRPDAMPGTDEAGAPIMIAPNNSGTGSTFKPTPGLVRKGVGSIIGRGTAEPAPEAAPDPSATPEDSRPIAQYAAKFENPDNKPPFAIVLIDPGTADLDRAALAALPFPVSFALDPLDPETPARAAVYRAAGKEVVMLVTGIAKGAQASDVEVAFQSMEQGLPEAVAAMDLAQPAFQNNRSLASAVVPILKAEGRGLLTWDEGLNAANQVARREDLEAAVVFRDLGSAGADHVAIRRLLDRAVFKAGQDGRVSVVGEANPETVAALLEWSVEGKAATVALAPLTAVLKVD
jgi:polysaccharide deacetylase 2 family uncharacterized protein YibQ